MDRTSLAGGSDHQTLGPFLVQVSQLVALKGIQSMDCSLGIGSRKAG